MDVDQTTAYTGTIADGSALKSPKEFSAKKQRRTRSQRKAAWNEPTNQECTRGKSDFSQEVPEIRTFLDYLHYKHQFEGQSLINDLPDVQTRE